jgi:hypothetical protein
LAWPSPWCSRPVRAPPPSPLARLTAAIKAAPTLGFIWGDGPTGYSIKYAWRSISPDESERIVLMTDRRLGAHTLWPPVSGAAADAEFTLIEMRHADAARVLLSAGADVNARSHYIAAANGRGFEGRTPVANRTDPKTEEFARGWLTPLMFAAGEGDVELARILLGAGAEIDAAAGNGKTALALAIFNGNYDVASFLVDNKADVNKADAQRFTPLFWAVDRRNMETAPNFPWRVTADPMPFLRKLLDAGANPNALVVGADLGAHDLGKKNDGQFGSSVEPLMPIDYAIGVGTFVPNNAVIIHEEAVTLMARLMKERGITHTTSECTLRGFTCAQAKVDPKVASPAEIMRARRVAIGHQIEGITGGLEAK